MPEQVSSSTQIFNSSLVDNIKDLGTDKIVYTYNDKKKNVSQGIDFCFAVII